MRRAMTVMALCAPLLWASVCCAQTEDEKAAVEAAQAWLPLVDAEKYEASWKQTSSYYRKNVSKGQWKKTAAGLREPLGALEERSLLSARYAESLPGAPDGEYVIIQFQTKFANKASATETITPMKDKDGVWRVSGYFIQ